MTVVNSSFLRSMEHLDKVRELIPCGTQTFSKGASYFPVGHYPLYIQSGYGPYVFDVDNNQYIDYILGLGAITLGYRDQYVDLEIWRQLNKGIVFGLPSPLEYDVAEMIHKLIPSAEMVRFSKTGSNVTTAAIKLAREYTGREHVACFGYHGEQSWFSCTTDIPGGTLKEEREYIHPFHDIESYLAVDSNFRLAAVILEPARIGYADKELLEKLRKLTIQSGAILIFDEMVTWPRYGIQGVQGETGITPDLTTMGKGIANGMPLGVLCGKKEIMEHCDRIFFSTTFGGECLSLAAAKESIKLMIDNDVPDHMARMGTLLMDGLGEIGIETAGYPARPAVMWKSKNQASIYASELAKRGVLIHTGGLMNISWAHKEKHIKETVDAFAEVKAIEDKIIVPGVIRPTFRRY
jgi:glutamate-1-semialdehyde 2,1-aminomutase